MGFSPSAHLFSNCDDVLQLFDWAFPHLLTWLLIITWFIYLLFSFLFVKFHVDIIFMIFFNYTILDFPHFLNCSLIIICTFSFISHFNSFRFQVGIVIFMIFFNYPIWGFANLLNCSLIITSTFLYIYFSFSLNSL